MKSVGRSPEALAVQIETLAGALLTLDLANKEISELDRVTLVEEDRFGHKVLRPHPVFRTQRDAMESITKQLKALGLCAAALPEDFGEDPLVALTQEVLNADGGRD